jgi:hypothetical protein
MGRSSILEGGIGLFLLAGSGVAVMLVLWAKGVAMRKVHPYQCVFEFPLASGISVGTPVRIRGVQVRRPAGAGGAARGRGAACGGGRPAAPAAARGGRGRRLARGARRHPEQTPNPSRPPRAPGPPPNQPPPPTPPGWQRAGRAPQPGPGGRAGGGERRVERRDSAQQVGGRCGRLFGGSGRQAGKAGRRAGGQGRRARQAGRQAGRAASTLAAVERRQPALTPLPHRAAPAPA